MKAKGTAPVVNRAPLSRIHHACLKHGSQSILARETRLAESERRIDNKDETGWWASSSRRNVSGRRWKTTKARRSRNDAIQANAHAHGRSSVRVW
jgi:hypothetical protein